MTSGLSTPKLPPQVSVARDDRAVQLFALLRDVGRVQLFQGATRGLLRLLTGLIVAGLLGIALDAVLPLPGALRAGLTTVWIGALLLTVLRGVWVGVRSRFDPQRLAREVECRLAWEDNLLINAVEFAEHPQAGDSTELRQRVVRLAEQRAKAVSALEVLPFGPVWRALAWGLAALLVGVACWWAAPGLFAAVMPRFADPWGDHPPYTLVSFDIRITPLPVYHGRPAVIRATLTGPETIDRADVVFLPRRESPQDSEPQRVPMSRRQDQSFELAIERPEASRRFYIDTPQGRSNTQELLVVEAPLFEEVLIRYEYPRYTGWPAVEDRLDGRGVRGLQGTDAIITARSNLPVVRGGMILSNEKPDGLHQDQRPGTVTLHPQPADPRLARGGLRLEANGNLWISLTARNGGVSPELFQCPVTVLPDRGPQVAFVQPQPHVVVVEDWRVPVVVEATDDVGVAALRLSRSVNDWPSTTVPLEFQPTASGAVRAETEFDLAALGARAGDVITYYATAEDNHPDPPHFADTPTYVIQVISQEEYLQHARQEYQIDELTQEFQAIQEQLDDLRQHREAALEELRALQDQLASDPDNPDLSRRMEAARKQLEDLARQAEELAEQLQQRAEQTELYDIEQPYQEALKKLAEQMRDQSQAAQAVADALERLQQQGATAENRQALDDALQTLRKQAAGLDQQSRDQQQALRDDLELFQQADRLQAQAERLRSVIEQQRDLATRLGEFQNRERLTPSEQQRADQLAKQQELLEQELRETADELEQAADAAQERLPMMSSSARDIADQIRERQIGADQQQAAAHARQGNGRQAFDQAEAAASKLESLAGDGEGINSEGLSGEMSNPSAGGPDGPLSLSRGGIQQALDQLAQGRGLPGLPRGGQSDSPGAEGEPQTAGAGGGPPGRWKPGQSFPGSPSRTPVLGPRQLVEMDRPASGGELDDNDRGNFLPGRASVPSGPSEQLTPEARAHTGSSAGNLRGVPVPFRKDAEAYFRRLAEDEAAP